MCACVCVCGPLNSVKTVVWQTRIKPQFVAREQLSVSKANGLMKCRRAIIAARCVSAQFREGRTKRGENAADNCSLYSSSIYKRVKDDNLF